jgi:hypothetical protein
MENTGRYRTYLNNNPDLTRRIYILFIANFISTLVIIKVDNVMIAFGVLVILLLQLYLTIDKFLDMIDYNVDENKKNDLTNIQ